MARLAAIAKGLYYPTPLRVVAGIEQMLAISGKPNQVLRVLDPCAGTGSAALFLCRLMVLRNPDMFTMDEEVKDKCTIRLYGIEMNKDRAKLARPYYHSFLTTNALSATIGELAFDIIFMNPPYDFSGDEDSRLESKFLNKYGMRLRTGGIMINIVPRSVLNNIASYQSNHFASVQVYKFPEPEYNDFKQLVIISTKRKVWSHEKQMMEKMNLWRTSDFGLALLDCPDNERTKELIEAVELPVHPDVEKDLEKEDDNDDDDGFPASF